MFFFGLLSNLFNKVSSSHGGSASATCPTVFSHHQLPYHLVQKCLCCPANHPGTPDSRRNRHSTLHPFDIHDAFTTKPLPWDVQVNPQVGPYRHPNHKSCLTCTRCPSPPWQARVQGSRGRQGFRQKPSWSLHHGLRKLFPFPGYCPRSTFGRCSVQGGVSSDITMPVHLTKTCRWRLYDSFNDHSQLKINDTYCRYQALMH